jgi:exo-1,4-beta-D-glucosaminidase
MVESFRQKLTEGWRIKPVAEVSAGGEMVSGTSFDVSAWTPAVVPGTVLGALVKAGVYQDLYVGMNMEQVPKEQFRKPWWYRTEFILDKKEASSAVLIGFDGINYKADIWVNGRKVAGKEAVTGAFRRFRFDITDMIQAGTNVLALEVTPPGPGDFSTGFVDWNIDPPDNNMGIFREVTLYLNKGVALENPFVDPQFNSDDPSWASLTITAEVVNYSRRKVKGVLKAAIDTVEVNMPVVLTAGERKTVTFSPHEYLDLNIPHPQLWWPKNLGNPSLYRCDLSFELNGEVSDREAVVFGIRKVEDFFENGHRGFCINGHKVLIKGAGWTDDLLLMDTHASLEAQIEYIKHLNLNCIRLEGFWGKDQYLYDLCDRYGILMMAGWTCHWEHEEFLGKPADPKYGGIIEPEDIDLMVQAWQDQILWLRNHPSIFVWNVGSDKLPHPDAERGYAAVLKKYDPTRPYLNSTGGVGSDQGVITEVELISEISGSSGMKMLGPYDYTPPVYWYTDKNFGGAYGFNTETCPGANVPPLESIRRMIPPDHLWPVDEVWKYHCGKNVFRTLDRFLTAVEKRYGKPKGVEDFAFKAQLLNYELMRPMFEAFQVNKQKAMGVVQWMLNSAWPNMYWQLYDSYLMPNGAFYATRHACRPLHLAYNYGDHTVHIINDRFETVKDLTARIRLVDLTGQVVTDERIDVSCRAESAGKIHDLQVPDNISPAYFLDLRLLDKEERELDRNFYWLSRTEDVLDYEYEFEDWPFYTPSKQYADYTAMKEMPEAELEVEVEKGLRDHCLDFMVTLNNRSESVAFFTELALTDKKSGRSFLPVYWDDNYISLLPGETRKVKVSLKEELIKDEDPVLRVKGWNVTERKLEA